MVTSLLAGQVPHGKSRATLEAVARCEASGRILLYYWFEDAALVWRRDKAGQWSWRLPEVDEVERLLGFQGRHTAVPANPHADKARKIEPQIRWKMMANTWHIPSFRFLIIGLLASYGRTVEGTSEGFCNVAFPLSPAPARTLSRSCGA